MKVELGPKSATLPLLDRSRAPAIALKGSQFSSALSRREAAGRASGRFLQRKRTDERLIQGKANTFGVVLHEETNDRGLAPTHSLAVPDLYRPAIDTIFGQLLGLFFSLRYNLTPDSPSPNGAISRVVQAIEIY